MPYAIKHDPQPGIIEATLTGLISGTDLREVTSNAISLQKQTGITSFLVNAGEGATAASLLDIYDLATMQYRAEELDRRSRIAVVLPPSHSLQAAARFYETVSYNHGWLVKVCADRDSAMDWLRGPSAVNK